MIDGNEPVDLSGLNKRDLRDIEKDLAKERKKKLRKHGVG